MSKGRPRTDNVDLAVRVPRRLYDRLIFMIGDRHRQSGALGQLVRDLLTEALAAREPSTSTQESNHVVS